MYNFLNVTEKFIRGGHTLYAITFYGEREGHRFSNPTGEGEVAVEVGRDRERVQQRSEEAGRGWSG